MMVLTTTSTRTLLSEDTRLSLGTSAQEPCGVINKPLVFNPEVLPLIPRASSLWVRLLAIARLFITLAVGGAIPTKQFTYVCHWLRRRDTQRINLSAKTQHDWKVGLVSICGMLTQHTTLLKHIWKRTVILARSDDTSSRYSAL